MINKLLNYFSYTRLIALSFLLVIATGTLLLSLPVSVRDFTGVDVLTALFTSTSATCVTGLVVVDTFTHWTLFGQIVILAMIQVGGIGLMTIITMFFLVMKKKIDLHERKLLMQSAGNISISGVVRLIKRIIAGTAICEGVGAILLAIRFVPAMGVGQGLYYAVFHAISAFCNAGFDLMGRYAPYSSLTAYETDALVSLTICGLIVVGGIGFLVWDDLIKKRWHVRAYTLHTKIVLCTTLFLIVSGTVGFLIFEAKGNLAPLTPPQKVLSALFMSVTPRTAGFNTMDLAALSQPGCLLSIVLMFIGGSPGSTAGGIKTSTIAIIFLAIVSMSRGHNDVTICKKRLETGLVKQAAVILVIYLTGVLLSSMIISHVEALSMTDVVFETVSAAGTVGLTRGITPDLGVLSRLILIILMYGGRIGGLSLMLVFGERKPDAPLRRPSEKILIG